MKNAGQIARGAALAVFVIAFALIWSWLRKQQMELSYRIADLKRIIGENESEKEDLITQYQIETARESLQRRRDRSPTKLQDIQPEQVINIDQSGRKLD